MTVLWPDSARPVDLGPCQGRPGCPNAATVRYGSALEGMPLSPLANYCSECCESRRRFEDSILRAVGW